jgi:adenylate cyclase class 2
VVVIEAESKYHSPGNDKIERILTRLGAKKISEGAMEDVYFAHPSRDFGKTDEALRLRKEQEHAELTYKGPRMRAQSTKAREEITLKIDNPLAAQRIVERLGFAESHIVKKRRTSYLLDELRIDVDDVDGLGEFVELEVLTESPEKSARLLETVRKELGLDRLESKTYLELLIEKQAAGRNT